MECALHHSRPQGRSRQCADRCTKPQWHVKDGPARGHHAHYVRPGYLVYAANNTLRAVAFDLDHMEVRGAAVPVVPRLVTGRWGRGFRRGRGRHARARRRSCWRDRSDTRVGGSAGTRDTVGRTTLLTQLGAAGESLGMIGCSRPTPSRNARIRCSGKGGTTMPRCPRCPRSAPIHSCNASESTRSANRCMCTHSVSRVENEGMPQTVHWDVAAPDRGPRMCDSVDLQALIPAYRPDDNKSCAIPSTPPHRRSPATESYLRDDLLSGGPSPTPELRFSQTRRLPLPLLSDKVPRVLARRAPKSCPGTTGGVAGYLVDLQARGLVLRESRPAKRRSLS